MFLRGNTARNRWWVLSGAILVAALLHHEASAAKFLESKTKGSRAADSLKLITVISRHGNRGSYKDYPLDSYPLDNENFWPYGPWQLTPNGRTQAYNLGKKLRSLYNEFIPKLFRSEDIYATSDPVERVVMSGQLVLAGLYPPVFFQVWNEDLNWQPIAIYTNDTDYSELLISCPRYLEEKNRTVGVVEQQEAYSIADVSGIVFNQTGVKLTAMDLFDMYDKLASEVNEGRRLPKWMREIYHGPLGDLSSKLFHSLYIGNDEIIKLAIGNLYAEIIENMIRKSNGLLVPDRRMLYYSAHDNTILGLEAALGAQPLTQEVHVASALVIELHQESNTEDYYVQVVYIDGTALDLPPQLLSLPQCGEPCRIEDLKNTSSHFFCYDFQQECHTSSNN